MDLTTFTPAQLERLERAAEKELQRRHHRKRASVVRRMLRDAARAEGYTLDAVLPEFVGVRGAGKSTPRKATNAVESPATRSAVGRPSGASQRRATEPVADASSARSASPVQAAGLIVRALAAKGSARVGVAVPLAELRAVIGLEHDWPAFHAALEVAARRNWVHFRGNDHCALTDDGLAASLA